jgi:hypothetical protein
MAHKARGNKMNEQDLRDCFAMFALNGLLSRASVFDAKEVWEIADAMLEARNKTENDGGITTIKKRKYVRKD